MAFSAGAKEIVEQMARGIFEDPGAKGRNQISYTAEFTDTRSNDSALMTFTYTLKKPISEKELNEDFENYFSQLQSNLGAQGGDALASIILKRQGFTKEDIRLSSEKGILDVAFNEEIENEATPGVNVGVQPERGRLLSQTNLKNLLEQVMKENLMSTMTSPLAGQGRNSPLKNRTGRFISSTHVDYLTVINNSRGDKQTLSLYYKYMIYPYQVFDPVHTKSPDMGLASQARNPQRLIHDALAKAAKTLVGERYHIKISQVR